MATNWRAPIYVITDQLEKLLVGLKAEREKAEGLLRPLHKTAA